MYRGLTAMMIVSIALVSSSVFAEREKEWGIAAGFRTASIPFDTTESDTTVSTFLPMMFFDNDIFFLRGIEAGAYLYNPSNKPWELSALSRLRFVDIPKSLQNANEGDRADFGVQLRYNINQEWYADFEIMSDEESQFHVNYRLAGKFETGDWEFYPSLTLRYKQAEFNSDYYAFNELTGEEIDAGIDFNTKLKTRYHLISNLYFLGEIGATYLDSEAYSSAMVNERWQGEMFVGLGLFNDKSTPSKSNLVNSRYLRLAHGWATPSNIGEIFKFKGVRDEHNHQMTSLFYGYPLTDELFGIPLDIYLTPGLAHHWSSQVQGTSTEYIMAMKAYYTFDWPVTWRFGIAEGMSYIDNVTYIESKELEEKGYRESKFLNYLDISFDVNVGRLFNQYGLYRLWFGYSLHHRSAIFESSSQFGRIKGGSNYNTIYLQYEF